MSPIERLKLVGALRTARVSLSGATGLAKLKVVKEIREIRTKLGLGVAPVGDPAQNSQMEPPPAGVYPDMAAFERDAEPLGVLGRMLMVLLGLKPDDWKSHAIDLGDVLNALTVVKSKDWQHEKEMQDPAFARAYRSSWSDAGLIAFDIKNIDRDNQKLKILEKIRGPWALDFVSRIAGGERAAALNLENYISDSKGYPKSKGVSIQVSAQEPAAPADNGAQAHLDALAAITSGQYDGQGLEPLYARIKAAVEGLNALDALGSEGNIAAANTAITHWAELDLKLNG